MALPDGNFELGVFLSGLARNLSHQQLRLNQDYEKALAEFLPILQLAKSLGYEELARTLLPQQIVMNNAELQVDLLLSKTHEQEFSVSVRPLNLGYTRKYKYSQFVQNTLRFEVRSIQLPEGEQPTTPLAGSS